MNKGLVMEVKNDYAIVMNDYGKFEKIKIKPEIKVGQKIFYFEEDLITENTVSSKNNIMKYLKICSSIAALFMFTFTLLYNVMLDKTYVVMSLDINPSIQISADKNQNIIKIEGLNTDAKNIDFKALKGTNINKGIEQIKDILVKEQYLDKNKDILVAVAYIADKEDNSYENNIIKTVMETFPDENVTIVKADKEDVKQAKEQGISLGRYEVFKVSDENTKQDISSAPVKDITEKIKDMENVTYSNNADKIEETKIKENESKKDNTEKEEIQPDKDDENVGVSNNIPSDKSDVSDGKQEPVKKKQPISQDKDKDVMEIEPSITTSSTRANKKE